MDKFGGGQHGGGKSKSKPADPHLVTALDGLGVLAQLQVAHGQVEEGSQQEGIGGFRLLLGQAVLHFQPGHDLPVLDHRLQVFPLLGWSKEGT